MSRDGGWSTGINPVARWRFAFLGDSIMKHSFRLSGAQLLVIGVAFSFGAACFSYAEEASQDRPPRSRYENAEQGTVTSRPAATVKPSTAAASDAAKDTIVLTVWDITISSTPENKKADEKANLSWRLN